MSMFTGLKAVNHFGRPDMSSFLKFVQKKHSYVSNSNIATNKIAGGMEEILE
jgi:dual oxidase